MHHYLNKTTTSSPIADQPQPLTSIISVTFCAGPHFYGLNRRLIIFPMMWSWFEEDLNERTPTKWVIFGWCPYTRLFPSPCQKTSWTPSNSLVLIVSTLLTSPTPIYTPSSTLLPPEPPKNRTFETCSTNTSPTLLILGLLCFDTTHTPLK